MGEIACLSLGQRYVFYGAVFDYHCSAKCFVEVDINETIILNL